MDARSSIKNAMFEEVADKFAGTRFCCGLRFTGMELETLYDLSSRIKRPLQCGTAADQSAPENEQGGDEPPALGRIQSPSATDKATRDAFGTNLRALGRV